MIRVEEIRDRQPFTAVELEEPVIRLVPIRYGEQCVPAVAVTTEDSRVYFCRLPRARLGDRPAGGQASAASRSAARFNCPDRREVTARRLQPAQRHNATVPAGWLCDGRGR
jgi:hypothetical protein